MTKPHRELSSPVYNLPEGDLGDLLIFQFPFDHFFHLAFLRALLDHLSTHQVYELVCDDQISLGYLHVSFSELPSILFY